MASYISSNNNRFYVGLEPAYGVAAPVAQAVRIPAVSLKTKHQRDRLSRRDKTGTRTFAGIPAGGRFKTTFELGTYMTGWSDTARPPAHGPLFEAALGSAMQFAGAQVSSSSGTQVTFAAPHGLTAGQGVAANGEMRFVTGVVNSTKVLVNAPFAWGTGAGQTVRPTYSFVPAAELKSASILDYWSPADAVHRLITGAAINKVQLDVNGDFHEFKFSGAAADMIDSTSFSAGQAGLDQFPVEPSSVGFDYSIIPGHLGQAWIGGIPDQFFTLASARVTIDNNVDLRAREYGSTLPRVLVPGERDVRVDFSVYAQTDAQTKALYQAARQESPLSVMFQLGQQNGQLCAVYLKSVLAEVPEFNDSENRLIWQFRNCRAQGSGDDEVAIAFG